jgi:hypothetical protein
MGLTKQADRTAAGAKGRTKATTRLLTGGTLQQGKCIDLDPHDQTLVSQRSKTLRMKQLAKVLKMRTEMVDALVKAVKYLRAEEVPNTQPEWEHIKLGLAHLSPLTIDNMGRMASRILHTEDGVHAMQNGMSTTQASKYLMVEVEYIKHYIRGGPECCDTLHMILVRDRRFGKVYLCPLDVHHVCAVELKRSKPTNVDGWHGLASLDSPLTWNEMFHAKVHTGHPAHDVDISDSFSCQICGPICTIVEIPTSPPTCESCDDLVYYSSRCFCTTCDRNVCDHCCLDHVSKEVSTCLQCWEGEI